MFQRSEGDELVLNNDFIHEKDQYVRGDRFKITRELWPDEWTVKDPRGKHFNVTNLFLTENFSKFEKPPAIPVPKTLKAWFKQTKEYING